MFTLAGKNFRLVRAGLVRAALPYQIARLEGNVKPYTAIVAVKNTAKLGAVEAAEYVPSAIVISGAMKRKRLLDEGIARSWMFVEAGALDIHADDEIGCNELMSKLRSLLDDKYRPVANTPNSKYAFIVEVYPFENYFVYTYDTTTYRQAYKLDPVARLVSLAGGPVPVIEKFVNASQKLAYLQAMQASSIEVRESMPRVETGIRYAEAPVKANLQSFTTGGRSSELVTQLIRNMSDINEAVRMYLDHANEKHQIKPAFSPVDISDAHKVMASLAAMGIDAFDFACWAATAQLQAVEQKTKKKGGEDIPRSKFAYVGKQNDPSTWKLPIHDASHVKNALARINQTQGIPSSAKSGVLSKIRKAGHSKGVDVSDKPTSGQKKWAKTGVKSQGVPMRYPSAGVANVGVN